MQKVGKLEVKAVKSPIITVGSDIITVLKKVLKKRSFREGSILVITSKVVAISQGKVKNITSSDDFAQLVQREADQLLESGPVTLTLKNNILIPWAGIDRSNIEKGSCVLWPEEPFQVAAQIWKTLKQHYRLKKIGILISDSTCAPLRRGVHAMALGYAGFEGVNDLRGKKDLYGNTLKVTQQAVADNLATAAAIVMGEADESTPFALIRGAGVKFTNKKIEPSETIMPLKDCLFGPLFIDKFDPRGSQ